MTLSIPSTDNLANKDLSNLSTTGQNIADTTLDQNTSTRLKYWTGTQAEYSAITTKDSNTIYNITDDGITYDNIANKDLSNLSTTGKNVIDGQWVDSRHILSTATAVNTYNIDLSNYLPDDNFCYEILLHLLATRSTNSTVTTVAVTSSLVTYGASYLRFNNAITGDTNVTTFPVGSNHQISILITGVDLGYCVIEALAYRRLGTNV